jgi:hypothetical protein
MDPYSIVGYLSGLTLIKPDLEAESFIRTGFLIHALDAVVCRVVATQNGRHKEIWTVMGLVFGIWALGALFLLPNWTARPAHPGQDS